jgi:putative oxidoreductase
MTTVTTLTTTTLTTKASAAIVMIRLYVGLIFAGEGLLKFMRPEALGTGRFAKVGIPDPALLAYFDGVLEIACGVLILAGLFTRWAVIPMIADMVGALVLTKVPLLWGGAALYPTERGLLDFFHEGRVEIAMLCGSLFLFVAGAGALSADARSRTNSSEASERVVPESLEQPSSAV